MEDQTCMEYLIQCVQRNHIKDVNQNILFNASNEFRNLWNLVKKLRELARVDVQKITRFLDAVQEGLEKKTWTGATRHCIPAETEYKQIRRYIRPSFLDDFKVSRFIENVDQSVKSKSGTKREKKPVSPFVNLHRRQNFRNRQINKQNEKGETESADIKQTGESKGDAKQQKETDNKESTEKKNKREIRKVSIKPAKLNKQVRNDKSKETLTEKDKATHTALARSTSDSMNMNNPDEADGESKDNETFKNRSTTFQDIDQEKNNSIAENTKEINKIKTEGLNNKNKAATSGFNSEENMVKNDEMSKNNSKGHIETDKHKCETSEIKTEVKSKTKNTNEKDVSEVISEGNVSDKVTNQDKNITLKNDSEINSNVQNTDGKINHSQSNKHTSKKRNGQQDLDANCLDISTLVSERMTEVSYECNAEEIVTELGHVYGSDWTAAYKALTGRQPSNGMKNTIDFLGEILKIAAERVKKLPNEESKELKKNKMPTNVNESLGKLKEEFLKCHLKILQAEHNIEYTQDTNEEYSVNLYSAKCVELAWFMFTRDPPMVFDYDSRPMLLEDLFEIFKPYKNRGNCIHYVVWPVIRRSHGGNVVAQGIADFR